MLCGTLLVVAGTLAACSAYGFPSDENYSIQVPSQARFFAVHGTTTKIEVKTVYETVTKASLCASLVNVTGPCQRRKRGMDRPIVLSFDEDDGEIDLYHPSPVQPLEITPLALLGDLIQNRELESSSSDPVEVDIIGLDAQCVAPRLFGVASLVINHLPTITIKHTEKMTATLTVTKTETKGSKAFFVAECTPMPFLYPVCKGDCRTC